MNRQTAYNLIFNGLGVLVGLIVVGYVAYSAFRIETEPTCSGRYPAPTRFALKTGDGSLLSPIELQARVGSREWGVMENAAVVSAAGAPTGAALEVRLAPVPAIKASREQRANGVHFRWTPSGAASAQAACLSYSLWLPEKFPFNDGGVLPALYGGLPESASEELDRATRFASRVRWRAEGRSELAVAVAGSDFRPIAQHGFALAPGRWISVEQEIVLNAPGKADGVARLWIDGELKAEDKRLALRADERARIAGVLADIGYLRGPGSGSLRLSPFELAWR